MIAEVIDEEESEAEEYFIDSEDEHDLMPDEEGFILDEDGFSFDEEF